MAVEVSDTILRERGDSRRWDEKVWDRRELSSALGPEWTLSFCATGSAGDAVVLLQLMFLAAVGVASAVGAALLFALLLLFMPLRRAIVLAALAVGSAVVGGGAGVFLMALLVDDALDTRTDFLVYFGGIATLAVCAALASTWAASKIVK